MNLPTKPPDKLASFGTNMDMIYRTSWRGWIIFHFAITFFPVGSQKMSEVIMLKLKPHTRIANSPGVSASRGVVFARAKSSQWQHALTALEDAWPRDLRVACMQKFPKVQNNKAGRFCWSFAAVQHPDLQRSYRTSAADGCDTYNLLIDCSQWLTPPKNTES